MRSLSECVRREHANIFLSLLEDADYNLEALTNEIAKAKQTYQRLLEDAEKGVIHDNTIFRVEMPELYADRYRKRLTELDGILEKARDLKALANGTEDYSDYKPELRNHLIEHMKKQEFKGYVKRLSKVLEAFQTQTIQMTLVCSHT